MNILITNDDGIRASGIEVLAEVASEFGNVKVFAPDRERSACSHAMTLRDPIRAKCYDGLQVPAWEVDGLPVDCVNLGKDLGFDNKCDLVLSGINCGPNLGCDVTYSGTVAGAMEGCICGIRSIAVSMALFVSGAPAHFKTGARWLQENWEMLHALDLPPLTFMNINVPAIAYEEIQGYRFVAMGKRVYQDRVERRSDPWGRPYYWQGGVVAMGGEQPGTDVEAVNDGYVAITPISLDWTEHKVMNAWKVVSGRATI